MLAICPRKNKNQTDLQQKNNIFWEEIEKSKFAEINDKRYYFSDDIVSLPFYHHDLLEIIDFKEKKKQRVENYFMEEKKQLFTMGKKVLLKITRLSLFSNILLQNPVFFIVSTHSKEVLKTIKT